MKPLPCCYKHLTLACLAIICVGVFLYLSPLRLETHPSSQNTANISLISRPAAILLLSTFHFWCNRIMRRANAWIFRISYLWWTNFWFELLSIFTNMYHQWLYDNFFWRGCYRFYFWTGYWILQGSFRSLESVVS